MIIKAPCPHCGYIVVIKHGRLIAYKPKNTGGYRGKKKSGKAPESRPTTKESNEPKKEVG